MPDYDSPEKRLWVGADQSKDLRVLIRLAHQLGHDKMPVAKLGPAFMKQPNHPLLLRDFKDAGVDAGLDATRSQNDESTAYDVRSDEIDGFVFTTVASTSASRLVAAAEKQTNIKVVAKITAGDPVIRDRELLHLQEANSKLDDKHQVTMALCEVSDIEFARAAGVGIVIATGIRMPHQERDDHIEKATPSQALRMGATIVAVCRPITRSDEPFEEIQPILDDIALAM